ncbi:uncharacterized protein A1O9_02352 [Exophiala aquamarina CBS 119918]|uniref:Amine oxidase n=1 Tax=Exophiala aquamarina CBS 119918 TaxID=1182545 RepID=A0A072PYX2_9EURO|nr:uncharacterized protein A1O9_02352 [Exophiala aquamarina CBS 119918]KEF60790.1 hypothetical protein A1O9_02352 [Exophiala aquamarina CBS 119918]
MDSKDGLHFDPESGVREGIPCEGVIVPSTLESNPATFYDAIVIGAGYSGLIATRDLVVRGHKVLLLEARDRIGGRTWTSVIEGYPYEMGGTWMHWGQPHVWTELSRYNLVDQLEDSAETLPGVDFKISYFFEHGRNDLSAKDDAQNMNVALTEFCNVDGHLGKTVFPFPHKPFTEAENYAKWDQVSAAERFDQIKDRLTPDQQSLLLSVIVTASGAPADQVACTEILRWWALAGYNSQAYMDYIIKWKLKCGQTGLALCIFRDALVSGNLSYRFSSPVQQIDQARQHVLVTTKDGQRISAQYLVCTVPLNTLNDISFNPPLSHRKALAASRGQVNLCVKAHAEVEGRDHRCWWGLAYSHKSGIMAGAFGDGLTPSGNAHLVSFSVNDAFTSGSDHGFSQMKAAYEAFHPFKIKRLLYHPWATDPYAKGTWAMYAPGFGSRFKRDLQASQGRVHFASADWADAWHGFIDGAMEQGMRASAEIIEELRKVPNARL